MTGLLESTTINERVSIRAHTLLSCLNNKPCFDISRHYYIFLYFILITIYSPYTLFHLHPTQLNHHTVVGALEFFLSLFLFSFLLSPLHQQPSPYQSCLPGLYQDIIKKELSLKLSEEKMNNYHDLGPAF